MTQKLNSSQILGLTNGETFNQNSTLVSFGDSITAGVGITLPVNFYAQKIADAKGFSLTNLGVGGARVNDPAIIDNAYAQVVDNTKNYTMMIGVNNAQQGGTTTSYLENYRGCLQAALVWLAIPDAFKIKAANLTKTGTWTQNSTIYGGMDYKSTTNGSTISGTVYGTTVYVGFIKDAGAGGAGGSFNISVDGQPMSAYATASASIPPRQVDGASYSAYVARIPGLKSGLHTVTLTVASATGANNAVYVDFMAGNGFKKEINGPNVWVANTTRATASYYSTHSPYSEAATALHNAMINDVVTELANDGLNVAPVDMTHVIDVNADMTADGLHPNEAGHIKMAAAFIAQMSSLEKSGDRALAGRRNSPWFDVTYSTGWALWDTGGPGQYGSCQYMKDAMGFVHIQGLARNSTGASNTASVNPTIFVLPVGFRPKQRTIALADGNENVIGMDIWEDGQVRIRAGTVVTAGWLSLNNIIFYGER